MKTAPTAADAAVDVPAWNRRGSVLLAAVALSVAIVFAYAGAGWPLVLYRLLADGLLLVAWLAAAAGWGGWPLSWLRGRDVAHPPEPDAHDSPTDRPLVHVTAIALGLGTLGLLTLGLGLAGWLNRSSAFALLAIGMALLGSRLVPRRATIGRDVRAWWRGAAGWGWLWVVVAPLAAMVIVGAFVPPGLLWRPDDPHPYDVVEYHFQVPREWHELGRIVPLRHNVFSFFPFAVEMHYLLAFHLAGGAWAGMYLAQLMHAAHVALAVAAVYAAGRTLTGVGGATIAGVAAATTPWTAVLAPVGYNEGGLLLYGTLAVGWALRALGNLTPSPGTPGEGGGEGDLVGRGSLDVRNPPHPDPLSTYRAREPTWRAMLLAGVMAGFACGVKLTAVPLLLVGLPVVLLVVGGLLTRGRGRLVLGCLLYGFVGALVFAPWAVRNLAWTGNPVFPEGQAVFGRAHFSEAQRERWGRAHAPRDDQAGLIVRLAAAREQIVADWKFNYALLPLAIAAAALGWRRGGGAVTRVLIGMLLLVTVFWLGFTHLQGRFFVLAIPLAALLVGCAPRAGWWRRAAGGLVVVTSMIALAGVHQRLAGYLYGEFGLAGALGAEDLSFFVGPVLRELPVDDASKTVVLVGDARAFVYPIPASRLRYRTVFDVDAEAAGGDVIAAWAGDAGGDGDRVLVIDPNELARFARTYWQIPPPPPGVAGRRETFVARGVPAGR